MSKKAKRHAVIRELMVRGEIEEAGLKASEWGIDIEDCKLSADSDVPREMAKEPTPEIAQVLAPKEPLPPLPNTVTPVTDRSKWPAETDMVIFGQPINKRMLLTKLADGRQAMLWKRGSNFPVGSKVRAKLCDLVGADAYYEPSVA